MKSCLALPFACWLAVAICGCGKGSHANAIQAENLVGKWRLVRADAKPPTEFAVKSQEITIAADGTWTSQIEGAGVMDGMNMKGGGTWALADGVVTYANGAEKGTSRVSLKSGHLVLDPDFHLRKNDATKTPIVGEYER